jgi:hypothetical protein
MTTIVNDESILNFVETASRNYPIVKRIREYRFISGLETKFFSNVVKDLSFNTNIFRRGGSISRKNFLLNSIKIFLMLFFIAGIGIYGTNLIMGYVFNENLNSLYDNFFVSIFFGTIWFFFQMLLTLVFSVTAYYFLIININKRLRDITGRLNDEWYWFVIPTCLIFIPFVNMLFNLFLIFTEKMESLGKMKEEETK